MKAKPIEELTDKDWEDAVHSGHQSAEKHLIMPSLIKKIKEKEMTKMGAKKEPKKRVRKPVKSRTAQKRRLDILFSKNIRDRANNTCEYCGEKGKRVECHHGVVHRRYMNTRYEPDNCVCVCSSCHRFLSDFPKINTEFFKKRLGADRMEQLEIKARTLAKVDLDEIENKIKE